MQTEKPCDGEYRAEFLKGFNRDFPECDTGIIGRSILGRDIDYYRLGKGKCHIVAVGAHHGMEHITARALCDFVMSMTTKQKEGNSLCGIDARFLLKAVSFFIIPCLNPDGVEMAIHGAKESPLYERQIKMNGGSTDFSAWQANARGVDLNHNYDYGFTKYKRLETECGISPGASKYSGEFPESEPETRSMAGFVRALSPQAIVSLHTQGEEIYSMPKNDKTARIADKLAKALEYECCEPLGTAAYGGLSDYAGASLGIPSFTVELGRGKNPLPYSLLPSVNRGTERILTLIATLL